MDFLNLRGFFIGFVLWVGMFYQPPYKSMEKSFTFRIFIKSVVYQRSLELNVVIAWTISID